MADKKAADKRIEPKIETGKDAAPANAAPVVKKASPGTARLRTDATPADAVHGGAVHADGGPGLAALSLFVGAGAGALAWLIIDKWIDKSDPSGLAMAALTAVCAGALSFLLIAGRGAWAGALGAALVIAGVLAGPSYWLAQTMTAHPKMLTAFPAIFWFFLAGPIVFYILSSLARASLAEGGRPAYRTVFFHGLTTPLTTAGAGVFAALAFVLLFAWGRLLKSLGVDIFARIFDEAMFILPFLGAIGGLAVSLMRGQQSVLGALRYILLLFSRIAMPIMAVFSLTLVGVVALRGVEPVFQLAYPSHFMLGIAFAGMLIFNGVYQNGEGAPPPAWLRISTIVTLLAFPLYTGLAGYAFLLRIGEYGLTPARIAGLTVTGLAFAYAVVGLLGVVTEIAWSKRRWMPLIGSANVAMAALWALALIVIATPLANPWAISARSQALRLAGGDVAAAEFDFAYLRWKLGPWGDAALDRLYAVGAHPEAAAIRAEIDKVRAADNQWDYDAPQRPIAPPDADAAPRPEPVGAEPAAVDPAAGPMSLGLNPDPGSLEENPENPE